MNDIYIWPEARLRELIDHPEPDVHEWAVESYFDLYPDNAWEAAAKFLQSPREGIVKRALMQLGDERRDELVPTLKTIYMEGSPENSTLATLALGRWKIPQTVQWMQERILDGRKLGGNQISAMLLALGSIPGDQAYSLLKSTESAIQSKNLSQWEVFYSALLKHQKIEDVETIIDIITNPKEEEHQRQTAFGVIMAHIDPGFNPSNAFFGNHAAVRDHLIRRLGYIQSEPAGQQHSTPYQSLIGEARRIIDLFSPDTQTELVGTLESVLPKDGFQECFEWNICHNTIRASKKPDASKDSQDLLSCIACSSMLEGMISICLPKVPRDSGWEKLLADLLRDRYPGDDDRAREVQVISQVSTSYLVPHLSTFLKKSPESWGSIRAIEMLGILKAVDAIPIILKTMEASKDDFIVRASESALLEMGHKAVPALLPILSSSNSFHRTFALNIVARRPTKEAVQAFLSNFEGLYAQNPEATINAAWKIGASELLSPIRTEYQPGEWLVGNAYVHICRIQGLNPPDFRQIERDSERGKQYTELNRDILVCPSAQWPDVIDLELACKECGKRYHYQVAEIHLHPHDSSDDQQSGKNGEPYKNGIVICDDIHCKNCGALNQIELTQAALAQLTASSLKLLAIHRSGITIPDSYPLKRVEVAERNGKLQSLPDMEREYLDATLKYPKRPQVHLALAKFYEYIKLYSRAKESYLKAIDLDSSALESMAGLGRIYHSEGKLEKAYEWIDSCYMGLGKGRLYLAETEKEFRKVVRQKRREFARELGIRPADEPVAIRFQIGADDAEYPKNRPCPCGSGKKYKLCCMKKGSAVDL